MIFHCSWSIFDLFALRFWVLLGQCTQKNFIAFFPLFRPFQAFLSKKNFFEKFDIRHWPCITMLSGQCEHTKGMIILVLCYRHIRNIRPHAKIRPHYNYPAFLFKTQFHSLSLKIRLWSCCPDFPWTSTYSTNALWKTIFVVATRQTLSRHSTGTWQTHSVWNTWWTLAEHLVGLAVYATPVNLE